MGYFLKSLGLLNWVGLIKMLQTVREVVLFDISISDICPAWRAPRVGTKPIVRPVARCCSNQPARSPALLNKIILFSVLCPQSGYSADFTIKSLPLQTILLRFLSTIISK